MTVSFSAVRAMARQIGWLDTLIYALDQLLSRLAPHRLGITRYYLLAQRVPAGPTLPPGRAADIRIHSAGPGDTVVGDFPRPRDVIEHRFEQQAHCLVAFKDQAFVGYHWLVVGPYADDAVPLLLKPKPEGKAAWNFDLYVAPAARLTFTFARLWDETHGFLRERGISWVMSRTAAVNVASRQAHRNMGALELGWVVHVRLLSWQLILSNCRPYVGLATGRRRFVEMDLDARPLPAPPLKTGRPKDA